MYENQVQRLVGFISKQGGAVVGFSCEDEELAIWVVEKACGKAGKTYVKIDERVAGQSVDKYVQRVRGIASKSKASVLLMRLDEASASAIPQLVYHGFKILFLLNQNEEHGVDVHKLITLGPCSADTYSRILTTMLASKSLLSRAEIRSIKRAGEFAKALGGFKILKEILGSLERKEDIRLDAAIDELIASGLRRFLSYQDLEVLSTIARGASVSEARALFSQLIKQMASGQNIEASWNRFLEKLRVLGVELVDNPLSNESSNDERHESESHNSFSDTIDALSELCDLYVKGEVGEDFFSETFWELTRWLKPSYLSEDDKRRTASLAEILKKRFGEDANPYASTLLRLSEGVSPKLEGA